AHADAGDFAAFPRSHQALSGQNAAHARATVGTNVRVILNVLAAVIAVHLKPPQFKIRSNLRQSSRRPSYRCMGSSSTCAPFRPGANWNRTRLPPDIFSEPGTGYSAGRTFRLRLKLPFVPLQDQASEFRRPAHTPQ